jgi:hypothetical protein
MKDFFKYMFPPWYPSSLPSMFFYDDNCHLCRHLRVAHDTYLDKVGKPVDVFHFGRKKKEEDAFCATNCNPSAFPELMEGDAWVFNSSACEQANGWFGKYRALTREMGAIRYNFYLDDMIMLRNRFTAEGLCCTGRKPHIVPDMQLVASIA